MIDFSDISIVVHCRIDNEERGKNAKLVYDFYNNNTINPSFIFIEDDVEGKLFNYIQRQSNTQHILTKNSGNWEKTKSYNKGAKMSNRSYLCFLDLDVIVHPKYINTAIEEIEKDLSSGIVLGYNGQSLYLDYEAKNLFQEKPVYERLECFIPREWLNEGVLLNDNRQAVQDYRTKTEGSPLVTYKYCTAPNSEAVGGCVITNKIKFFEYGGFNPNFTGWGYEDSELPIRVHRLGHNVIRVNFPEALLFHLPHDPPEGDPNKTANEDNNKNHDEFVRVRTATKEKLQEYIKSWNV